MSNSKTTVAIPVFNGEKFILESLNSIVNQTHKVDNIIVCDNRSTDGTREIVEEFFKENSQVSGKLVVNESNLGYQKNFNKCMEVSETDYLLLLASDDRLKPNTIEILKDFMDSHPDYALAGGYADNIDENGNTTFVHRESEDLYYKKGEILEFLQKNRLYLIPSSVLLRMEFIKKIGYWDLHIGPDERYWPKVIKEYPIAILSNCAIERRLHTGQTAVQDYFKKYKQVKLSLKENLKVANYESGQKRKKETRAIILRQNSSSSLMMGNLVIKHFGDYKIGLNYLLFSITQTPSYSEKFKLFYKTSKIFLHGLLKRSPAQQEKE